MLSVIIPTLNAASDLPRSLSPLVAGVIDGLVREVIIADGGSVDETLEVAEDAGCVVAQSEKGRGAQLRVGATVARSPWLLFLHADTALEGGWIGDVRRMMREQPDKAAYFRFGANANSGAAQRLSFWVNLRCATLALPYGDQGLLISRALYDEVGGYNPLPLMEDVDLVRRLGRARLVALPTRAVTSVAKFERDGYLRRSMRNLVLVSCFLLGADPHDLAKSYD